MEETPNEKPLRESVQVDEKNRLDKLVISEFRESIKENYTGIICPTCNRLAKEDKVKLNKKMCLALLHILKYYRYTENVSILDYFDVRNLFYDNPEFIFTVKKLEYWDLVEAKGEIVNGNFVKEKNMFRISENGIKFAQREVGIPIYAVLYDKKVRGHQLNPNKTIDEILKLSSDLYENVLSPDYLIRYPFYF
jgi:hypothetical protein